MPTPEGLTPQAQKVAATATLMAIWWLSEIIPLSATAFLPMALFPLMGIHSAKEICAVYGDPNIFLFAGGFFLAMAMQKWKLHERIALNILLKTGTKPSRLVLGFMLATGLLSMWISNTATSLMMLPIAMAMVDTFTKNSKETGDNKFAVCLLLSIAYSASIGGIGTLIGTPPNGVLLAMHTEMFPASNDLGFLEWMFIGVPLVGILIPVIWLLLTKVIFRFDPFDTSTSEQVISTKLRALGSMSQGEKSVLIVWIMTAIAWIFLKDIHLGTFTIPGWNNLFPDGTHIHNGTIAIFSALILFIIPVNLTNLEFVLDWEWAQRIPWGILIVFGGGLALAKGFMITGLVPWLGTKLTFLQGIHPLLVIASIATFMTFLTEMTSNMATATIMLPILGGSVAPLLEMHPVILMIPATISASCAFMLPVATPPNAVVFGSGQITISQMANAGFFLNIIGIIVITSLTYFLVPLIFDIS